MPWQPRRATAIWEAALRGPLAWLGLVAWDAAHPPCVARVAGVDQVMPPELPANAILPTEADAAGAAGDEDQGAGRGEPGPGTGMRPACAQTPAPHAPLPAGQSPSSWQYGAPGALRIPHTSNPAAVLRLVPFADWCATDTTHSTYQVTPGTLARAASQGWSDTVLWQLLTQQAGPPPDAWIGDLHPPGSRLRIIQTAVLVADAPAVLTRAAQSRSVRRYLDTQLAPGIALAHPAQVPALLRALAHQDLVLEPLNEHAAPAPRLPDGRSLSAAACAALLLACAFYRQYAPPDAPYVPPSDLEERLRAGLTPALRQAVTVALADLPDPAGPTATQVAERLREAAVQVQLADAQRVTAERRARDWERRARQAEAQLQPFLPVPVPPPPMPADDFWGGLAAVLGPRPPDEQAGDDGAAHPAVAPAAPDPPRLPGHIPGAPHPADGAGGDGHPDAAAAGAAVRPRPLAPGSRVHVQFDRGIMVITAPDGRVTTAPLDAGARAGMAGATVAPLPPPAVDTRGAAAPDARPGHPAAPPPPPGSAAAPAPAPAAAPGPAADPIPLLRRAIARRRTLAVAYATGGRGQVEARLIRPLALEAHGLGEWRMENGEWKMMDFRSSHTGMGGHSDDGGEGTPKH